MLTLEQVEGVGGFQIIYADPGWQYAQKVRTQLGYTTMAPDQLKALPVGRLAARDCALFCWATWPQLDVALETIAAWGFTYKTLAFLWVKRNPKAGTHFWGAGQWTRANTEPCLLAVRGKPKRVDMGVHQLIEEFVPEEILDAERPNGEHSAKPRIVRDKIIQLMGDLLAIELFARDRDSRFCAWGDDPGIGQPDVRLAV